MRGNVVDNKHEAVAAAVDGRTDGPKRRGEEEASFGGGWGKIRGKSKKQAGKRSRAEREGEKDLNDAITNFPVPSCPKNYSQS